MTPPAIRPSTARVAIFLRRRQYDRALYGERGLVILPIRRQWPANHENSQWLNNDLVYNPGGELIAEYGAEQATPNGGTSYLTTDHLGSTRVVTNNVQAVVSRHDYLPFGEEITLLAGGRTGTVTGGRYYQGPDDTHQKFTSKERDTESNLDLFGARYYSSPQGRFTGPDKHGVGLSHLVDPQRINRYVYTRNNPLTYSDTDGNDLKLKPGLSKADQDRIIKDAVTLYRKDSGRQALNQLSKSDITYVVGTGKLETKVDLFHGTVADEFGNTKPRELKGKTDSSGKASAISREGVVIDIVIDADKRDSAEKAADAGFRATAPESEQHVFDHEVGHAQDKDKDLVAEYNETPQQAEKTAEAFANGAERQKNTMSQGDAEAAVRQILGLPAKEQKKH